MYGLGILEKLIGKKPEIKMPENLGVDRRKFIKEASEDIPTEVKDKVDKIIFANDAAVINQLFKELLLLNNIKGVVNTVINQGQGTSSVSVTINGNWKKGKTLEKICLDILKESKDANTNAGIFYKYGDIYFPSFSLSLGDNQYSNTLTFEIGKIKKLTEKEFIYIKELFEKHVLGNANMESSERIDEEVIAERFEFNEDDIVIFEEKSVEITMNTEDNTMIEFEKILQIANEITDTSLTTGEKIFVNTKKDHFDFSRLDQKIIMEVLTVNIQTPVSFTIIIQKNKISIYIKLPNVGFDKKFLTNILIPIVKKIRHETSLKNQETLAETLLRMGVQVYEMPEGENRDLATLYENNGFVGYEDLKEQVEHGVINAWQNKEKFEEIAKKRFKNIKDIIPNAVLFEGPAGTGKTTLANIIGSHLNYPFIYIPINSFMSKWYGEAEKKLARIFEKIGELAEQKGGAVIMIDEIDEIGGNREKNHEATGKITGVLLKKLDGMERIKNILLIGATNRKDSLDPALLSRFKYSQFFRIPNESEIPQIITYYLPELIDIPLEKLTPFIGKISGRDIKNTCEDVTRIAIQNEIDGKETDLLEVFLKSLNRAINK